MLVIIEGPDCVGKTTLATRLRDTIALNEHVDTGSIRVRHAGPPRHHPLWEYVAPLVSYRPGTGRHVICDRWHLGEVVYPKVFGRRTYFDPAVRWYTEMFLRSRGALIVYVSDDPDDIRRRLVARGDDLVTPDMVDPIYDGFNRVVRSTGVPVWEIDTSEVFGSTRHVDDIYERAHDLETDAARLNGITTYVGSPTVRTLLLGDVRGKDGRYVDSAVPAFMPYTPTSGHYLLSTLLGSRATPEVPLAGITRFGTVDDTTSIGIANACDVDDVPNMLDTLKNPNVVALGRQASVALGGLGVAFTSVEHPQYRRRFHYADGESYAKQILEMCR